MSDITLPDTPQDIYDSTLALTGTAVDVFELTIGSLTYSVAGVVDDLVEAAWERFGRRPIGDYDYEYWIDVFDDGVKYNWRWYEKSLPLILDESTLITLEDSSSTMTETDNTVVTGTVAEVIDTDNTYDNTTLNTGTVGVAGSYSNTNSGTIVQAQETMPDTVSASSYLSGRVTTTDTTALANTHTDTTTNNLTAVDEQSSTTDTTRDTNNESETTRAHSISTKNNIKPKIELTLEIVKQMEELNDLYLSRLDKYFMHRW